MSSSIIGGFYFLLYTFCILIIFMIFSIMTHFSFFNSKKYTCNPSLFIDTSEFEMVLHICYLML